MTGHYRTATSCKDSHEKPSLCKTLGNDGSHGSQQITSNYFTLLATVPAIMLVTASAGLGALYAWQTGSEHGLALGALSVLMALGLEIAKPLAIASIFEALRTWRIGVALAMAALGIVAVAYSLTAELSLMAGARGDHIAVRQAENQSVQNAQAQRNRIEVELATIGTGRPSGAISAELNAILTDRRLANCETWLESTRLRTICIEKVAPLKSELASAERRETLQGELAGHAQRVGMPNAEVKPDPAASALSTYLAALGVKIDSATLSEWIVLVPVIALEVGSAFAAVLARGLGVYTSTNTRSKPTMPSPNQNANARPSESVSLCVSNDTVRLVHLDDHAERLVSLLHDRGGEVFGGQRAFASALNISAASVNRLLGELSEAGRVHVETGKHGTRVKLVAGWPNQLSSSLALGVIA